VFETSLEAIAKYPWEAVGLPVGFDVVVIGAGVAGTSVAYHAALRGLRVMVLDAQGLASGASGSCDGFICMQTKAPGAHLRLAIRSARLLSGLASDIGLDYRPQGVLVIMGTWAEREIMEAHLRSLAAEGVSTEIIEGRHLALEEPILRGGEFVGASLSTGDGTVDPIQLTCLFARAASRNGASLCLHSRAVAIRTSHGRVHGVKTTGGFIPCGSVVVAAGLGTGDILGSCGLELPMRAVKGQLLVSEPLGVVTGRPMLDARYIALKHNPGLLAALTPIGVPVEVGFGVEQTTGGNLLIGNTREPGPTGSGTTLEALGGICRNAARIAPAPWCFR